MTDERLVVSEDEPAYLLTSPNQDILAKSFHEISSSETSLLNSINEFLKKFPNVDTFLGNIPRNKFPYYDKFAKVFEGLYNMQLFHTTILSKMEANFTSVYNLVEMCDFYQNIGSFNYVNKIAHFSDLVNGIQRIGDVVKTKYPNIEYDRLNGVMVQPLQRPSRLKLLIAALKNYISDPDMLQMLQDTADVLHRMNGSLEALYTLRDGRIACEKMALDREFPDQYIHLLGDFHRYSSVITTTENPKKTRELLLFANLLMVCKYVPNSDRKSLGRYKSALLLDQSYFIVRYPTYSMIYTNNLKLNSFKFCSELHKAVQEKIDSQHGFTNTLGVDPELLHDSDKWVSHNSMNMGEAVLMGNVVAYKCSPIPYADVAPKRRRSMSRMFGFNNDDDEESNVHNGSRARGREASATRGDGIPSSQVLEFQSSFLSKPNPISFSFSTATFGEAELWTQHVLYCMSKNKLITEAGASDHTSTTTIPFAISLTRENSAKPVPRRLTSVTRTPSNAVHHVEDPNPQRRYSVSTSLSMSHSTNSLYERRPSVSISHNSNSLNVQPPVSSASNPISPNAVTPINNASLSPINTDADSITPQPQPSPAGIDSIMMPVPTVSLPTPDPMVSSESPFVASDDEENANKTHTVETDSVAQPPLPRRPIITNSSSISTLPSSRMPSNVRPKLGPSETMKVVKPQMVGMKPVMSTPIKPVVGRGRVNNVESTPITNRSVPTQTPGRVGAANKNRAARTSFKGLSSPSSDLPGTKKEYNVSSRIDTGNSPPMNKRPQLSINAADGNFVPRSAMSTRNNTVPSMNQINNRRDSDRRDSGRRESTNNRRESNTSNRRDSGRRDSGRRDSANLRRESNINRRESGSRRLSDNKDTNRAAPTPRLPITSPRSRAPPRSTPRTNEMTSPRTRGAGMVSPRMNSRRPGGERTFNFGMNLDTASNKAPASSKPGVAVVPTGAMAAPAKKQAERNRPVHADNAE